MILEQDPNAFARYDEEGQSTVPEGVEGTISENFVDDHMTGLLASGSECAGCRWKDLCRGYFKLPDPSFSCAGMIRIFDRLKKVAEEMDGDLAAFETNNKAEEIPPQES
jgi:hypothetical protein